MGIIARGRLVRQGLLRELLADSGHLRLRVDPDAVVAAANIVYIAFWPVVVLTLVWLLLRRPPPIHAPYWGKLLKIVPEGTPVFADEPILNRCFPSEDPEGTARRD